MGFPVGDKYRTSELSLRPGGYTITIVYHDWHVGTKVCDYKNVKKPYAYIRTAAKNPDVKEAFVKK